MQKCRKKVDAEDGQLLLLPDHYGDLKDIFMPIAEVVAY
jgi:hypothetical protein